MLFRSEQRELAATVRRSSEALLVVLNDILDFSKVEAGRMQLEEIDFDLWGTIVNREFRPGALIDRIPLTTKILWLPAEKDELIPLAGPSNAPKSFKGTSQAIVLPYITHFQAYSHTGFEVGSTLAAEWFLKYLGSPTAPKPTTEEVRR